jgi:predicted MPP superfamily phosphohydrolase
VKISILHISDLHRDPHNPIGNEVLLDSLENDRRRYTIDERPQVRSPDLILVTGDIIHGIRPNVPNPEKELKAQYAEALDFLNRLSERLLNGDKRRVVVVPGNHDVGAWHVAKSLKPVDVAPDRKKELVEQLFSSNSLLRWSWADFALYEIADGDLYAQRLAAFADFYKDFYEGTRTYSLDPSKQFDIFDFRQFELTIAGFCSCFNNDIFNKQGAIHPECIGAAGMKLRERDYDNRLRIAVWHHNTEGLPFEFNYMDPDILQNLIDRGFSLGFHGHQHKPQFLDTRFRHEGSRRITVISAGTLCGGASFRFGRAYNVVEIDTQQQKGLLYLREMQNDNLQLPIWGRRSLPPNTGSYLEFGFDPPPEPMVRTNVRTIALLEAQKLYDERKFAKAAEMLVDIAQSEELGKRLLLDCLSQSDNMAGIISHFDPPTNPTEAIYVLEALRREGRNDRLCQLLDEPMVADSTDPSLIEMRKKYAARLKK